MPYSGEQQQWIRSHVNTDLIGREILTYDSVESTNDLAKSLVTDWNREGTVILADSQTRGRGRLGKSWHSEKDLGIYLSTMIMPELPPENKPQITMVAGVAVVQAINQFSQERAHLKWPNDILLNQKKVAGILTENHQDHGHSGIIIGIGVNVNHSRFPIPLQHLATSLAMENGQSFDRLPLIAALITQLDSEYRSFLDHGLPSTLHQWSQNSEIFGLHLSLTQGDVTHTGTAINLDERGRLVVLLDTGEERAFDAGEVTLIG